jgi:CRISP-associated protein Cas1
VSYHVLHVLQHGSLLSKDRGFLVCESEGRPSRKLPFEDVRAVVIAARGVTLTSNFVSAILDSNGIILHCDESYQPCGISVPLARIVDLKSFQNQTAQPARLNANLWQRMLHYKTRNQHGVLAARKLNSPHLERAMKSKFVDEANCAKRYWQLYFPSIGWISTGRDRKEQTPPNQMLN